MSTEIIIRYRGRTITAEFDTASVPSAIRNTRQLYPGCDIIQCRRRIDAQINVPLNNTQISDH